MLAVFACPAECRSVPVITAPPPSFICMSKDRLNPCRCMIGRNTRSISSNVVNGIQPAVNAVFHQLDRSILCHARHFLLSGVQSGVEHRRSPAASVFPTALAHFQQYCSSTPQQRGGPALLKYIVLPRRYSTGLDSTVKWVYCTLQYSHVQYIMFLTRMENSLQICATLCDLQELKLLCCTRLPRVALSRPLRRCLNLKN